MLKIRFKRTGRKKKPFYKIIVTENLSKRDGKALSEIGYYDPLKKKIQINKKELFTYLLNGAYPTNSVRHLIYRMLEQQKKEKKK